jgi:hypothetical protein
MQCPVVLSVASIRAERKPISGRCKMTAAMSHLTCISIALLYLMNALNSPKFFLNTRDDGNLDGDAGVVSALDPGADESDLDVVVGAAGGLSLGGMEGERFGEESDIGAYSGKAGNFEEGAAVQWWHSISFATERF